MLLNWGAQRPAKVTVKSFNYVGTTIYILMMLDMLVDTRNSPWLFLIIRKITELNKYIDCTSDFKVD